jgi:hypothetical protein
MSSPDADLDRLHSDLDLKPLSPVWAKVEIILGLFGVGTGLLYGVYLASRTEPDLRALIGALVVFVLGGYLALAGHRSHLYQSNNRLAAYLAGLIRRSHAISGPDHEHPG